MTDLGWANGWTLKPLIVTQCQEQKHKTTDADKSGYFRGQEHVVTCQECKYIYRYDSSD